jgi:hypothetical protein
MKKNKEPLGITPAKKAKPVTYDKAKAKETLKYMDAVLTGQEMSLIKGE